MVFSSSDRTRPPGAAGFESTKLVIGGGFGVGKTTLVGSISEIAPINTDVWMTAASLGVDRLDPGQEKQTTTVGMDFGRITFSDQLKLFLFGTPGQPRFWPMWDDLCRGAQGALVLVNEKHLDASFGAINYFDLDQDLPWIVAVNRFNGQVANSLAEIRAALRLDPAVPITDVDARDRASVKAALVMLVQHAIEVSRPAGAVRGAGRQR